MEVERSKAKAARGRRPIRIMSKTQYLLLASFVSFYGMLFTFLLVRALAGMARARTSRIRPVAENVSRRVKSKQRRGWAIPSGATLN